MLAAAVLVALAARPVLAQEHEHGAAPEERTDAAGMMQMMQMMGGGAMGGAMMGMMESMHPQPAALLRAADALALSPEQREHLHALTERTEGEARQHMSAAMAAHQEARSALGGERPDVEAYAAALRDAVDHMVHGHAAMARASVEAVALLTPAQREELSEAMQFMRGMSGGMMGGSGMER